MEYKEEREGLGKTLWGKWDMNAISKTGKVRKGDKK